MKKKMASILVLAAVATGGAAISAKIAHENAKIAAKEKEERNNISYQSGKESESGFILGAYVAAETKSSKLKIVSESKEDAFLEFIAGFIQGAKTQNPLIKIEVAYLKESPSPLEPGFVKLAENKQILFLEGEGFSFLKQEQAIRTLIEKDGIEIKNSQEFDVSKGGLY